MVDAELQLLLLTGPPYGTELPLLEVTKKVELCPVRDTACTDVLLGIPEGGD
jgi:hypothetical protein